MSPRSRIEDVNITENHRIGTGSLVADRAKKHKKAGHDEPPYLISEENTHACGSVDPPLDGQLVGRYLDGCIAAAEAQLAGKGGEVRRREAVR